MTKSWKLGLVPGLAGPVQVGRGFKESRVYIPAPPARSNGRVLELSRGVDHEHRDLSQPHHFFGHGPEEKPPPAAVPVGGDDNHVGLQFLGTA